MKSIERLKRMMADECPLKWVFTGDSITHGALHTMGERDYTEHFSERLRTELGRYRDIVIKSAVNGWRICDVIPDLSWNILQHQPDIVSINFGMNDCKVGVPGLRLFQDAYQKMLGQITSATNSVLILHTPPGILPMDEARVGKLDSYISVIRTIADSQDAIMVDNASLWQEADDRGSMIFWMSDSCHPNGFGHRAMAHHLFRSLEIYDIKSQVCRLFVP